MSLSRFVLVASVVVPAIALVSVGRRVYMPPAVLHFGLVAGAAAIACGASAALTVAGARRQDGRAVLLGVGFSTMTALLAVHGLATPGILVGPNGVVALAGGLSVPAGALLLALSALPPLRRPRRVGALLVLQGVLAGAIAALGSLGLLAPSAVPAVPTAGSRQAMALAVIGAACLATLVVRAGRTFALTRRPADALVAVGCGWLGLSLMSQLMMGPMTLAFYLGHGLELAAVGLIGVPVALDLRRAGGSRPLVGDLSATDLVASEEAYLGPRVRALLLRLAAKDGSTEQHTRRVALLATQVGEELGLPACARRHLAVGGLLHDMGKLTVPVEILRKPGRLNEEEFAAIKRHPEAGRRLLEELGGFPDGVHDLVSDHHERLDGSGYPRGLRATAIPLPTRVLAACDVFDALVSDRVYRAAWTPQRALALLHAESATAHDPRVIAALERIVARREGEADEAGSVDEHTWPEVQSPDDAVPTAA